jgi:hypothetical protein
MRVPLAHRSDLLVDDQQFRHRQRETMQGGVNALKVVEVLSKDDLANGCGAELQHVLVCVPCFASFAQLVEYGEGDAAFVVPGRCMLVQNMRFDFFGSRTSFRNSA